MKKRSTDFFIGLLDIISEGNSPYNYTKELLDVEEAFKLSVAKDIMRKYYSGSDVYSYLFTHDIRGNRSYRTYIDLNGNDYNPREMTRATGTDNSVTMKLVKGLQKYGYEIENLEAGLVRKRADRKAKPKKIGSILDGKHLDKNIKETDRDQFLEWWTQLKSKTSKILKNAKGKLIVISRHPYDVAGMSSTDRNKRNRSDGEGWSSCQGIDSETGKCTDSGNNTVGEFIELGALVAYTIRDTDLNIEKPLGRVLIVPHVNHHTGDTALMPNESTYGSFGQAERKAVLKWLDRHQTVYTGIYQLPELIYNDDGVDSKFIIGNQGTMDADELEDLKYEVFSDGDAVGISPYGGSEFPDAEVELSGGIELGRDLKNVKEFPAKAVITSAGDDVGSETDIDLRRVGLVSMRNLYFPEDTLFSIDVSSNSLKELADMSRVTLTHDFNCSINKLKSLKGSPKECNDFDASHNQIRSLEGCSQKIRGRLNVVSNKIKDLKGGPESVTGSLNLSGNPLVTFEGDIKRIEQGDTIAPTIYAEGCKLTNVRGCPDNVFELDVSRNNINSFKGLPVSCKRLVAQDNKLQSLKSVPDNVEFLNVSNNPITSLNGVPKNLKSLVVKGIKGLDFSALKELPENAEVEVFQDDKSLLYPNYFKWTHRSQDYFERYSNDVNLELLETLKMSMRKIENTGELPDLRINIDEDGNIVLSKKYSKIKETPDIYLNQESHDLLDKVAKKHNTKFLIAGTLQLHGAYTVSDRIDVIKEGDNRPTLLLEDFKGESLENVSFNGERLVIQKSKELKSLDGFKGTNINTLYVWDCPKLSDVSGVLQNTTWDNISVTVKDCNITSLQGFPAKMNRLDISGNPISTFDSSTIREVNQLDINNTNISSMKNSPLIKHRLDAEYVKKLKSLDGLQPSDGLLVKHSMETLYPYPHLTWDRDSSIEFSGKSLDVVNSDKEKIKEILGEKIVAIHPMSNRHVQGLDIFLSEGSSISSNEIESLKNLSLPISFLSGVSDKDTVIDFSGINSLGNTPISFDSRGDMTYILANDTSVDFLGDLLVVTTGSKITLLGGSGITSLAGLKDSVVYDIRILDVRNLSNLKDLYGAPTCQYLSNIPYYYPENFNVLSYTYEYMKKMTVSGTLVDYIQKKFLGTPYTLLGRDKINVRGKGDITLDDFRKEKSLENFDYSYVAALLSKLKGLGRYQHDVLGMYKRLREKFEHQGFTDIQLDNLIRDKVYAKDIVFD